MPGYKASRKKSSGKRTVHWYTSKVKKQLRVEMA